MTEMYLNILKLYVDLTLGTTRKLAKLASLNKLEILKRDGMEYIPLVGYVRFVRSLTIPTSEPFSK